MEYCLLGKNVNKSLSKLIHSYLPSKNYELVSLKDETNFLDFLKEDFKGANVTIPYKQLAFSKCDKVSKEAEELGVVNTLIKKDGLIFGFNTDILGFDFLLKKHHICYEKCLILGTGSTSKTIEYCLNKSGSKFIKFLSRNPDNKTSYSYENSDIGKDIELIVNTTPVKDKKLINFDNYPSLKCVIDVNYYPYRSSLLVEAKKRNIKCINGLEMLIAQAFYASELFTDSKLDESLIDDIYLKIKNKTFNIVLVGHPFSGKSKIGKELSKLTNKTYIDLDEFIENKYNMSITEIFSIYGEDKFREYESEAISYIVFNYSNCILSTGGGTLINNSNLDKLLSFGLMVNLTRPIDLIKDSELINRPLIKSRNNLIDLINKRRELYRLADFQISNDKSINEVANQLKELI